MKIASWNINSVRARIDIVERFLREMAPDILCLQETKVENHIYPAKAFRDLGYHHIVLNGQKMHHGVAIISKVPLVEERKYDWQDNGEARHIGVRLPNGVLLEMFMCLQAAMLLIGRSIPNSARSLILWSA
jgi:exodeoxyribonuclease III